MLDGINVLAQHTVLVQIGTTWGFSFAAIIGSIFILAGLMVIYSLISDKECPPWAIFLLIICFGIGIGTWKLKPVKQELTEYKATIDETVSLREFNERYVMIDCDGEIYTFRERADNEPYTGY